MNVLLKDLYQVLCLCLGVKGASKACLLSVCMGGVRHPGITGPYVVVMDYTPWDNSTAEEQSWWRRAAVQQQHLDGQLITQEKSSLRIFLLMHTESFEFASCCRHVFQQHFFLSFYFVKNNFLGILSPFYLLISASRQTDRPLRPSDHWLAG